MGFGGRSGVGAGVQGVGVEMWVGRGVFLVSLLWRKGFFKEGGFIMCSAGGFCLVSSAGLFSQSSLPFGGDSVGFKPDPEVLFKLSALGDGGSPGLELHGRTQPLVGRVLTVSVLGIQQLLLCPLWRVSGCAEPW